jgi:hypothetical protein
MLEPNFRTKVVRILQTSPLPLQVFETYRSAERQVLLYEQRATELRTVGVHHYGLACDIVKSINGEPSWKGDFSFLGKLAESVGVVWGGSWTTIKDMDHVQWCDLRDQPQLFAGTWYPDANYNPTL